jgi:hypothetical protein
VKAALEGLTDEEVFAEVQARRLPGTAQVRETGQWRPWLPARRSLAMIDPMATSLPRGSQINVEQTVDATH